MKILLDECVTHDMPPLLVGHDVATVAFMKWTGIGNGTLLQLAADKGFQVVITTDSAMPDQHSLAALPISIVVLHARSNRIEDIGPLVSECLAVLDTIDRIGFYRVR